MYASPLDHLRDICLALPETTEAGAADDPIFSVKGKTFATGHHMGDGYAVWFKATPQTRERLLTSAPGFFAPRYVGRHGWLGAWLDDGCDWTELTELLRDSHRMTTSPGLLDLAAQRDPVGLAGSAVAA
ncbi:putative DNA-binding protein (MmcQ/YjbR family) [Stackebrandtia albiflava]|uniref:Putative DNA-binding protein (MmcQ/YjbR family) n=1 Tax=Stackebrandtia albiflava TaxID=406432 RepID=A0A562V2Q8_9ACTN|nr:MmcQ/YjbR family DNA-binding protein [Stackebrandtia albiflava]TWJ12180.1 putative DNA-binding protein (MmcQ/YjbR family) [Stackebrandtia albiflava]